MKDPSSASALGPVLAREARGGSLMLALALSAAGCAPATRVNVPSPADDGEATANEVGEEWTRHEDLVLAADGGALVGVGVVKGRRLSWILESH